MALDFTKTADDTTLIQTLAPLVADTMWHDGITWWSRSYENTWVKSKFHQYWRHLYAASHQLPDTPYWTRSRHRLAMSGPTRQIAFQLAMDCWTKPWPRPADLP